jgi:hypothetical protein
MKTTKEDAIKRLEQNENKLKHIEALFFELEKEKYLLILQRDVYSLNIEKYKKIIEYYENTAKRGELRTKPL